MFALMPWLRKYRVCGDENAVTVDKFKFSKDGDVYKRFASGRALGISGRKSLLTPVREESTSLERSVDKEEATIASLRDEIERLKEENEQLKEASKQNMQLTLNTVEDLGEEAVKNEDSNVLQHEDNFTSRMKADIDDLVLES